ncbi:hypothetical protein KVR01_004121 [Diaporthe batatas]|uniref:uncharacterized protein n=1 Tax=Diaporthe batatas TaxID=748121 RepID=UPI001D0484A1|nr:uncharacterized protein KVR01_004121 [Diaporthe batatas]KAG8165569.1 hypothetical protein KVR01_004121 [Diaporthe batatas]
MLWTAAALLLLPLTGAVGSRLQALARDAPAPTLPDRKPFGFASMVTGGGAPTPNNTYVVDNMVDLRTALKLETPRTIYVKGELKGSEINETTTGDCQFYIDSSRVPNFNFTLYIMALNSTYTDAVKAAEAAGEEFEGKNATEYLNLLNKQNGWRGQAQNVQKSWESIDAKGDLTLVGWDSGGYLNGVSLNFNTQSNIIIRNLRISPPRDCFPSPETYPSSWNARYDAISFVTTTNAWLDGNILEDGPEAVAPEPFLWGWLVDRYDGLFDVEDGSDNITFSHNIIANHHKSLLWGGGEKEGPRDIGRMRFTVFGNHFVNSMSRNPLVRFGTVYIANNVFSNYNNRSPLYNDNSNTTAALAAAAPSQGRAEYAPDFQYNVGLYNMSSVLMSGNYFDQTGQFPDDETRIFTFSNLATPDRPATLCSPPDLSADEIAANPGLEALAAPASQLNGRDVNLVENVADKFAYYLTSKTDSVEGGLVQSCAKFGGQAMPRTFGSGSDVLAYVNENAGQVGRNRP